MKSRLAIAESDGQPRAVSDLRRKVRKAVFPVGGLGTSFLPITKAVPREMLPIVDRPLIQYAVDEALAAGIRELIFVTHRSKRAIEDYFDRAVEFERELESKGRYGQLAELRGIAPDQMHIVYARQSAPHGLGHAIHSARHLIGNEPFAVLLPGDLIDADPPVLTQLVECYQHCGESLLAVQSIRADEASRHGVVETADASERLARVVRIVDGPTAAAGPLAQAVVGRYVFSPRILDCLDRLQTGANNEVQLTDGIARLLALEPVRACRFEGTRYDCGSKLGFLSATLAYAARHPELGGEFRTMVTAMAREWEAPRISPEEGAADRSSIPSANSPGRLTLGVPLTRSRSARA